MLITRDVVDDCLLIFLKRGMLHKQNFFFNFGVDLDQDPKQEFFNGFNHCRIEAVVRIFHSTA